MTTTHAIEYLRQAQARPLSKRAPVAALWAVTKDVKAPCRAIGLAREMLIKHGSIPAAIEALEGGKP